MYKLQKIKSGQDTMFNRFQKWICNSEQKVIFNNFQKWNKKKFTQLHWYQYLLKELCECEADLMQAFLIEKTSPDLVSKNPNYSLCKALTDSNLNESLYPIRGLTPNIGYGDINSKELEHDSINKFLGTKYNIYDPPKQAEESIKLLFKLASISIIDVIQKLKNVDSDLFRELYMMHQLCEIHN
uniref:Uncharacterized protein n=1 Tax=Mimivirus LCMiAC02 TaxID=2506609 RepID=A0A481Z2U1_9VIRU|nr:MAG: hypothetical protein LCMiAC02_01870 [Mimivirus LCMiAC02]